VAEARLAAAQKSGPPSFQLRQREQSFGRL
jgi:hypothetical protein